MTAPALFVSDEPPEREDPETRRILRALQWVVVGLLAAAAVLAGYTFEWWRPQ